MITSSWRREGDSNPRYGSSPYNGLANRRLQPLGHPSDLGNLRVLAIPATRDMAICHPFASLTRDSLAKAGIYTGGSIRLQAWDAMAGAIEREADPRMPGALAGKLGAHVRASRMRAAAWCVRRSAR
jgi:hypothetical protein